MKKSKLVFLVNICIVFSVLATTQIYYNDHDLAAMYYADLSGQNSTAIVTELVEPKQIAVDEINGKIYWADSGSDKIYRSNIDGSNASAIIEGLGSPNGVAVDVTGGKIYWTDRATDKIQRANVDGTSVEDLITQPGGAPYDIALDTVNGKLYWTDFSFDKIQQANLDGSSVVDIVTTGTTYPRGIAVDATGGKLYWCDSDTDNISRADLDGTNIQVLVTGLSDPNFITLDVSAGNMYWTNSGTGDIKRATMAGVAPTSLVTPGNPVGIVLGDPEISLSVELSLFVAEQVKNRIKLTWKTESETDNLGFILQRSFDNTTWVTIASYQTDRALRGQGDKPTCTEYEFCDNSIEAGSSYFYRLSDFSSNGEQTRLATISVNVVAVPQKTELFAAYPNPFNPQTTISYQIADVEDVNISIYDLLGHHIATLINQYQSAGQYDITWNAVNEFNEKVPSGVYLIRLQAGSVNSVQKVMLMK